MENKIEDLKKLHAIWQTGSDTAAADASNDIMEALPELLARLERYDDALDEIAAHYNGGITGPGRLQAHADRATLLRALDAMAEENARLREALSVETKGSLTWWVDFARNHAEDMAEEGFLLDRSHWEHIVFAAQTQVARAALKKTGSFTNDPFNRAVLGLEPGQ